MTTLHIDFETRSTVDLRKAGAHVYAEHETTDVWCMAYCVDDGDVRIWTPGEYPPFADDVVADAFERGTVVAHNASFELAIWNRLMAPRYGWKPLDPRQVRCTMAMAYAMALPGGLDDAAAAVGLDVRKDAEGSRLMMQMARPRLIRECRFCMGSGKIDGGSDQGDHWTCEPCRESPGKEIVWWDDEARRQRLYEYCRQDVRVERELEKRLLQLTPAEQELWVLDQKINDRGVRVDLKTIGKLISAVETMQARLTHRMVRVTGGRVEGASKVQQLEAWVAERIGEIDGLAKADVTALLERDDLPADVREALEIRREAAKSSTSKLKAMRASACADGRVRGTMQYHGASTGRWAGRRVQTQNLPRSVLGQDEIMEVLELFGRVK